MSEVKETEVWKCTEHNQDEWFFTKGNGVDEYYHVKRLKMFEQSERVTFKAPVSFSLPTDFISFRNIGIQSKTIKSAKSLFKSSKKKNNKP